MLEQEMCVKMYICYIPVTNFIVSSMKEQWGTKRDDVSDNETSSLNKIAVSCLLNHALCSSKLGWYDKAITDCNKVSGYTVLPKDLKVGVRSCRKIL